jgi:competence protein ComEC
MHKSKKAAASGNAIKNTLLSFIALAIVLLYAYFNGVGTPEPQPLPEELVVTFIDVGQGDSELIQLGENAILIDSGESEDKQKVIDTLEAAGVQKLDYVIATHPHADHMGSMSAVIDQFAVEHVLMPNRTATTVAFEKLLKSIQTKGLRIERPQPGAVITAGGIQLTIIAPNAGNYADTNDFSIVCKLVYGQTSFLFTGDAEAISEREILEKGYDISADVLKAGHHGSSSSTTPEFLAAVQPGTAVISCGAGNTYGHPHRETMESFEKANVTVYRTDLSGDIIMRSDGTVITVETGETGETGEKNR